jgi:hypothetical protein
LAKRGFGKLKSIERSRTAKEKKARFSSTTVRRHFRKAGPEVSFTRSFPLFFLCAWLMKRHLARRPSTSTSDDVVGTPGTPAADQRAADLSPLGDSILALLLLLLPSHTLAFNHSE